MKQALFEMNTKYRGLDKRKIDSKQKEGLQIYLSWWRVLLIVCLIMIISPSFLAAGSNSQNLLNESEILAQADVYFGQGGLDNIEKAMNLYQKAADFSPESYQANWKCAKAYYTYSETVRRKGGRDWKEVCKKYGKKGFQSGEKAIALEPDKIEGNIYYGLCVWKYSDGVSIITALSEGLKGSTQDALEKSYEIDKKFDTGWPMKALGRFWHQLPWPLRDYEDSLRYLEEHHAYFPDDPQGLVFLAETLIALNDHNRAKGLLKRVENNNTDQYYNNRAKELLKTNFK